jgi:hypothetical protein
MTRQRKVEPAAEMGVEGSGRLLLSGHLRACEGILTSCCEAVEASVLNDGRNPRGALAVRLARRSIKACAPCENRPLTRSGTLILHIITGTAAPTLARRRRGSRCRN